MKKYDSYTKSDLFWLQSIPSHWQIEKIGKLFSQVKCKNYGMAETNLLSLSYGTVKRRNINATEGLLPESFEGYNIIESGDIVLRLTDLQNDQKSLRTGLSTERGIITSAYITIRNRSNNLSEYLQMFLHVFDIAKGFYNVGASGVRQGLGWDDIKQLKIAIPPHEEQDQIVRFLDWKVSAINRLINIKRKEIHALDSMKRSVVIHGLDPTVRMKYSGVRWLGNIPAHWSILKFRQILHPVSVKNHPELPLLSVVREQGVIVRNMEDKETNHNFIPDDLSNYKVVKSGQFATNKMKAWQGSYGISGYTGIVSPAYFIFDVSFPNLEYFHYAIRSKVYVNFFAQASDGIRVGQWDLQMDKMKEIPFIVPPADEQIAIVKHIKAAITKYEAAIENLSSEIRTLEEYKTCLISDVVTGKVDVRDIDIPEYEFVNENIDTDGEDETEEQEDI